MTIGSYGKIYNVGHRYVKNIFDHEVTVEEKVDGSQFSMGVIDGQLVCRSRNRVLDLDTPDNLFQNAVTSAKKLAPDLVPGWVYRGEYLSKPKHNTLKYSRIPIGHIALYDIDTGNQDYLSWEDKYQYVDDLGLEVVPLVHRGKIESQEQIQELMKRTSFLGDAAIEGLVFKSYGVFGVDGKTLMAKFVSEAFKETHVKDWKDRNQSPSDIRDKIIEAYRTPARWDKAVQHLMDSGKLEGSPTDIGSLMKELNHDLLEECSDEIKELLFEWAKKYILRGVSKGFPEWYKNKLVEDTFDANL